MIYPRLEYMLAYAVKRVSIKGDTFNVTFEGGGTLLVDEVPVIEGREHIDGLALMQVVHDADTALVYFGSDANPHMARIQLTNGKYKVSHPSLHGGELFDPNRLPADDSTPALKPTPGDRMVDGPVEPA